MREGTKAFLEKRKADFKANSEFAMAEKLQPASINGETDRIWSALRHRGEPLQQLHYRSFAGRGRRRSQAALARKTTTSMSSTSRGFRTSLAAKKLAATCSSIEKEQPKPRRMKHVQLSTTRLRFLFLAAKIWCHSGRVGVSYSDHYEEKGIFQRLMDRLRTIKKTITGSCPLYRRPSATDGPSCIFLCTVKRSSLTTYNIGRTQTETIKRRLKKMVARQSLPATGAICVHNLVPRSS